MTFRRGSVWFVDIPGVGDKPAVVVSWQPIQEALGAAIVARVTSARKRRSLPTAVELDAGNGGLTEPGYVLCHELSTVPLARFRRQLGRLSTPKLLEVENALRRALDLS